MTLEQRLAQIKIVPVIAINHAQQALPLAKVLMENGLPCAEITFRTEAAQEAIRLMRDAYPEMLIGAGTVLTTAQVDQAQQAGADFIVSPGLNPTTVKYCQQRGIAIVPGVNNPSLVEQAMELGLRTLKFFPAEPSGGVAMLKALSAVYPVKFMPTGGISAANVQHYLDLPSVVACGGTWMVPTDLMDKGDWSAIAKLVREL
ncbi:MULTISPECIES: bifunctional 4-hydroxy-2-oxoglutarate aldolase/2-dehydro-3-deoxy-phosphogluconate aldolase [Vibrio]|uniref:bifunctional 4-hydroxy-2-oxoglutarate aldolase/2-dehydro-3-deoxy-phosphogluconate aldolase n=1 Tax=Vibrio TaxID=662 RepID=UPI0016486D50|nr:MULTISPECIES: bifunctional 4-hydroxy-2-oxoglutarate aldolase/2-dehydro-3-deoxy-phosphogluconate aldolase [Vibrio]EKO3575409.1 bifunctional 4-hydroxy-2-oxoglutarate aldolase/2-dehydro-3-deoxy-phosphogluconate aldolase [Vibrio metschnikovii]EKO3686068.1 bifunctional 4-hydroxy-2-oxoglutarate aldolase/2-dehydro-3-deoxy-phosphogluconate aldolase [Vibrio metschnikovii]EKO3689449.1 bifunctional 4-hydroxy-2-oxoglutarate aldolase/2-dehydro-3-deoxy-phosphogluconate aldolase [Vibrio metschnikovii]EKO36